MANDNKTIGLGEISTIRDILMGQQMSEYNERFKEMEASQEKSKKEVEDQIKDLDKALDKRLSTLEKDINSRFDKLEELLLGKVSELENRMDHSSVNDKKALGAMLQEVGNRLMNGK